MTIDEILKYIDERIKVAKTFDSDIGEIKRVAYFEGYIDALECARKEIIK